MKHHSHTKQWLFFVILTLFFVPHVRSMDDFCDDIEGLDFASDFATDSLVIRFDPEEIMDILNTVDAPTILREDSYLHTHPLAERNIIDLPAFEPDICLYHEPYIAGATAFWNKMSRSHFTKENTNLESYLAFTKQSLLESIQNTFEKAFGSTTALFSNQDLNVDITKLFSLFKCMTVEERRVGIMFHFFKRISRLEFRLFMPLYYRERNLFLEENEQRAVEEEFGAMGEEEQDDFQKKHFISDKIGLGDTRLEIDFEFIQQEKFSFRIGPQCTIPTAVSMKKGLAGSSFPKSSALPEFSLKELIDLAQPPLTEEKMEEAFKIVSDFLLGAVDRLSANLLDMPLGNHGHFGVGGFMRTKTFLSKFLNYWWADNISFNNRMSVEFLSASQERRFFIKKNSSNLFDQRDFTDVITPGVSASNLAFLEQELIERLYPLAFDVKIQPGFQFRWSSRACYEGKKWSAYLGTDLWVKGRETLDRIDAAKSILCDLDIAKATPLYAYQSRALAGIVYKLERPNRTWLLSLYGDSVIASNGIGKDYTLAFKFEANF